MKICPKLFGDLNFEPNALTPCCNTRALQIPSFPYTGGFVDMPAYAAHIQNVANQIQHDAPVCRGCPDLKELSASGMDAAILFQSVSINMHRYFCNCKCTYCDLWNKPDRGMGYDVLPGLMSLHEQNVLAPNCFFSWGGGEPSILPGFEAASAWILDHGYVQNVHTNAIRFSPAIAKMLKDKKGTINISLDSSSPEIYQKVKGVNAFGKVMASLNRYCAEGDPSGVTLKYIVHDANNSITEIERFLKISSELGVRIVLYSLNFKETNARAVSDKTILATAFLRVKAAQLGLPCKDFFVDEPWKSRIAKAVVDLETGKA